MSTLSGLLGPVLGGLMFGLWGITPILLVSAGCFALSAIMEIFIRIPYAKRERQKGIFAQAGQDVRESFRFVKEQRPHFFSVIRVICAFNLVFSAALVVGIPVIVVQILGLSDELLGYAQGAMALGGLAGGIFAALLASKLTMGKSYVPLAVCALCGALMGVGLLCSATPMLAYGMVAAMGFIAMAVSTVFTVQMLTTVQQQTPQEMIGKIMAVLVAVAMCAQPIGQALYGFLFDQFQTYAWLVLMGTAIVSGWIALYSKRVFQCFETPR